MTKEEAELRQLLEMAQHKALIHHQSLCIVFAPGPHGIHGPRQSTLTQWLWSLRTEPHECSDEKQYSISRYSLREVLMAWLVEETRTLEEMRHGKRKHRVVEVPLGTDAGPQR